MHNSVHNAFFYSSASLSLAALIQIVLTTVYPPPTPIPDEIALLPGLLVVILGIVGIGLFFTGLVRRFIRGK